MSGSFRGTPRSGLIGATLGFFVGFAAVALFGPTARRFQEVMELTPLMVGFLVAMPALSGSILRIPFSAWVDTTGGRKPFLVLLALSVVGMAGVLAVVWLLYPDRLTAATYPLLLLLGVLCGCGIATFSVGISQVSYWYPQGSQGRVLAIFAGFGNVAPGIFSFLIPVALGSIGLAGSYLAWLAFLAAGTAVYVLTGRNAWYFQLRRRGLDDAAARERAREQGQELFPAGSLRESLARSARVWRTWALVAVYFTTFGGFIAMTAWLPTYWTELHGTPELTAGLLTGVYSILASLIRIPGGFLADARGGAITGAVALVVLLAGALVASLSAGLGPAVAGIVLMAIGMGVTNAAVFKLVPQVVPDAVGGAVGWVGGLGAFGGFAIPPVLGWAVRAWGDAGYARGYLVFVALAALSLGMVWLARRGLRTQASPGGRADEG